MIVPALSWYSIKAVVVFRLTDALSFLYTCFCDSNSAGVIIMFSSTPPPALQKYAPEDRQKQIRLPGITTYAG